MAKRNSSTFKLIKKVIDFIITFICNAYKAGRIIELLISTPILLGLYYLLFLHANSVAGWVFLIPILVYSGYWWFLFSHEKITSEKVDPNWANRDWWWNLDGWEFEEEVAKIFRLNGYRTKVTKKTSDGGIDILMYKDGKKIIVQCKHYTSPVGVAIARELNGLKDDFKADELIIVASSGVTKSCWKFLDNKSYFKIFDLEDIIRIGLRPS